MKEFFLEEIAVIEVKNLTKVYGHHRAVDNISFTVNDGEILGFLGPNGAGKTTTMNMMTGFISATEGTVTINGHDILDDTIEAKKELGYLPDVPPLYGDMRVDEYLNFVCDVKGVKKSQRKAMLDDITATVGISEVRNRICRNLSKGYRQRVGLAQALVGYPSVLILDEPTVGLDPNQIIEMRRVIKKLGQRHTILLSSHILSEVSAVCDRVMIINNGKILISDTIENLEEGTSENVQIVRIRGNIEKAVELAEKLSGVVGVTELPSEEDGTYELSVKAEYEADVRADLVKAFTEGGIEVVMLKNGVLTLEQVFLKVINGDYEAEQISAEMPAEDTADEEPAEVSDDVKADNADKNTDGVVADSAESKEEEE